MSAENAPPRDGRGLDDHPNFGLDAHNTISLCAGESLVPRPLPRAFVYLLNRSQKAESVRLWECEAWSTGGLDDVIWLPGDRWATGVWNERETNGYGAHPVGGFPLVEVSKEQVIALCKRRGRVYPMPILRELAADLAAPPVGLADVAPARPADQPSGTEAAARPADPSPLGSSALPPDGDPCQVSERSRVAYRIRETDSGIRGYID